MDLYQIRYFLAIAETGSFSRAAERLYLSQPSLSTGIKKLERELGVPLFERGGRRTVLTPAGRAFLTKAEAILEQYRAALHELKGFRDRPTLRVGVVSTMRVTELAELVGRFRKHYPHVTMELHDGTLETLQEELEKGTIDVAISVLSLIANGEKFGWEAPQICKALFRQPLWLAVPKNHPFAERSSVCLADLDGQPFIARLNCEFFKQECQILNSANVHPQVVYRASHEEWTISLLAAGLGIAIMPFWKGLPGIQYIPLSDLDFQRTIGLKWRQKQHSDLVQLFCNFATSHNWESQSPLRD